MDEPTTRLIELLKRESECSRWWGETIGLCKARENSWDRLCTRIFGTEVAPSVVSIQAILMDLLDAEDKRHQ